MSLSTGLRQLELQAYQPCRPALTRMQCMLYKSRMHVDHLNQGVCAAASPVDVLSVQAVTGAPSSASSSVPRFVLDSGPVCAACAMCQAEYSNSEWVLSERRTAHETRRDATQAQAPCASASACSCTHHACTCKTLPTFTVLKQLHQPGQHQRTQQIPTSGCSGICQAIPLTAVW